MGAGDTPSERLAKFARVWMTRGGALRGETVYAMETGEDGCAEITVPDLLAVLSDRADLLGALGRIAACRQTCASDEVEPWELQDIARAAIAKATGQ